MMCVLSLLVIFQLASPIVHTSSQRHRRSFRVFTTLQQHQHRLLDAKEINKEITATFANPDISQSQVVRLQRTLQSNSATVNAINVVTLLHRCAKRRRSITEFLTFENITRHLSER